MLVVFPPIFAAEAKITYGYNFVAPLNITLLIHFMPLISFDTPWQYQKNSGFVLSGGYQNGAVARNELNISFFPIIYYALQFLLDRDHSFSAYVKFFEKLTFVTTWAVTNVSFSENFAYVINDIIGSFLIVIARTF